MINTPNIPIPFKTAHANIPATYGESSASARLTEKSRVVAGILNTLMLPPSVKGGETVTGTVALIEAVSVNTVAGLAAEDPGAGGLPMNRSAFASVPSSITITAGDTRRSFTINATRNITPGTTHPVRIAAGAVVTLYASLTVTAP